VQHPSPCSSKINSTRKVGWKNYKRNGKPSGWRVELNKGNFYIHRIIWILLHGSIDNDLVINHIDCNPFNNKHDNLELCTSKANGQKHKCHAGIELRKENKSGYTGVHESCIRGYMYAGAQWADANGKKVCKYFSYKKYGKDQAILLAVKARSDAIENLNKNGASYPLISPVFVKLQPTSVENRVSKIETIDETPKLLVNRWKCKDGTILQSKHQYDYVDHVDANNEYSAVDGGTVMIRVSGELTSLCLYSDDKHEDIRMHFYWGTYLNNYRGDKHWIPLYRLGDSHIQAILDTQMHIPEHIRSMFIDERQFRKQHGITVEETTKE